MRGWERPDWPAGSNAALVARQVRCSTGATNVAPRAGRWLKATAPEAATKRLADGPAPVSQGAIRLLAELERLAAAGAVLPSGDALAASVGLTRLTQYFAELRSAGLAHSEGRGPVRQVELVQAGVMLSTAEPARRIGA